MKLFGTPPGGSCGGHHHHHVEAHQGSAAISSSYNNNTLKERARADHWRSVLDNVFIEFLGALFIIMAEVMYGDQGVDAWREVIPAAAIAGALMGLKDGDCFFPDATPTVTLLMWSVGAYDSWIQPCARILGQVIAMGVAIGLCQSIEEEVPTPAREKMGHAAVFLLEMLSTVIEHMGAVYLFIPMLPLVGQGRVRAKHHHETEAPPLAEVMFAAVAFAVIHWALRVCFMAEMNPLVTLVKGCVHWHGDPEEMLLMLWGEAVGVLVAMVYIVNYYAPRKQRRR